MSDTVKMARALVVDAARRMEAAAALLRITEPTGVAARVLAVTAADVQVLLDGPDLETADERGAGLTEARRVTVPTPAEEVDDPEPTRCAFGHRVTVWEAERNKCPECEAGEPGPVKTPAQLDADRARAVFGGEAPAVEAPAKPKRVRKPRKAKAPEPVAYSPEGPRCGAALRFNDSGALWCDEEAEHGTAWHHSAEAGLMWRDRIGGVGGRAGSAEECECATCKAVDGRCCSLHGVEGRCAACLADVRRTLNAAEPPAPRCAHGIAPEDDCMACLDSPDGQALPLPFVEVTP